MIGLCCQYLVSKNKTYVNAMQERTLQYGAFKAGKYNHDQIVGVWQNNVDNTLKMLPIILRDGIKCFRFSSNYFPLYDFDSADPYDPFAIGSITNTLTKIGKFVLDNNIRLTCHPDQFVVLSSRSQNVIDNSIGMLCKHAAIMDCMNLPYSPYYSINIHGGVRGEIKTLISTIKNLPQNVKSRLTLENDERSYNVVDLYEVYKETGIPIVFDSHHHTFNDAGLSIEDALFLSMSTWGDVKPLSHLSNTDPAFNSGSFSERRKHSDYVHYIPECQRLANNSDQLDIEFEFKMKNLAIKQAVSQFDIKLH